VQVIALLAGHPRQWTIIWIPLAYGHENNGYIMIQSAFGGFAA
jgi:hypothetical protein